MPESTPLARHLAAQIAATGPMRLDVYMAACLTHPELGYYTTRDPLGAAGDFTTAPEISQMFGELVGLALAQAWLDQGRPDPFVLAELGPGRGTLMADLWRATTAVPGFHDAARLSLVEASPVLREAQAARLTDAAPAWCDRVEDLPAGPLFLVANEYVDALPIRQFVRREGGWAERMVTTDADGALAFALAAPMPVAALADEDDVAEESVVVVCVAVRREGATLGARLAAAGGAALIVDYGGPRSRGDTLQAVAGHAPTSPLAAPGAADLTAHVDFGALADAATAAGAASSGPVPQGVWLERLGITARAQALAAGLSGDARVAHVAAHRRLTHPEEMGSLFQVLALTDGGAPPVPGT